MKIVYIDRSRWWGGAEESLAWLAGGMRRRGHEAEIVVDFPQPHHERYRQEDLPVVPRMAKPPVWAAERWRRPPPGLDRLGMMLRARTLSKLLATNGADIVHINLMRDRSRWDAREARGAGRLVVGHLRQLRGQAMPSPRALELLDQVVAVSNCVAEQARASGCAAPVEMIYDGVDAGRFVHRGDQASARAAIGAPEGGIVVGFPAALEPRKGQDIALEAFARLAKDFPDATLAFAGGATDLPPGAGYVTELKARASAPDLAGRVRFLGALADMGAFYAACDVVLALSRDGEAFGRVPAEAAFASRPTVGVRAGATTEVILDGETGFLAAPDDAESVTRVLRRLLANPDLRGEMGARARERAAILFDSEKSLDAFEALYERMLATPGR